MLLLNNYILDSYCYISLYKKLINLFVNTFRIKYSLLIISVKTQINVALNPASVEKLGK